MVITDCVMSCTTQDSNGSVRAGNDLVLSLMVDSKFTADTTDTADVQQALHRASLATSDPRLQTLRRCLAPAWIGMAGERPTSL